MNKLFKNKVVIISGGLGDIGRAIAEAFAHRGANIALCDKKNVAESADLITLITEQYGVKCQYNQVDVANSEEVDAWLQKVTITLGTPVIVIPNAATVTVASIHELTDQQWTREMEVNLNGAYFLAQKASQLMVAKKLKGSIVFIGSWAGHTVHQNMTAYCVSKAGMRMLCKCMALELAPYQILVNEVAPGYVMAGLTGKIFENNPNLIEQSRQKVPTKKIMTAASVAREVIHLCDPENEDITGSTILIDGGLSLLS